MSVSSAEEALSKLEDFVLSDEHAEPRGDLMEYIKIIRAALPEGEEKMDTEEKSDSDKEDGSIARCPRCSTDLEIDTDDGRLALKRANEAPESDSDGDDDDFDSEEDTEWCWNNCSGAGSCDMCGIHICGNVSWYGQFGTTCRPCVVCEECDHALGFCEKCYRRHCRLEHSKESSK